MIDFQQKFRIKKAIAAYRSMYKEFLRRFDRRWKRTMLALINYIVYCSYKTALKPGRQDRRKFERLIKMGTQRYCFAPTSGASKYILNVWRANDEFLWKRGDVYHSQPTLDAIAKLFRDELELLTWDERQFNDRKRQPRRYHLNIGQLLLFAECLEEDLLEEHYNRVGERGNIADAIAPHCCYTLVVAFDFIFGAIGRFWRRVDEDVLQPIFSWDISGDDYLEFWNFIS